MLSSSANKKQEDHGESPVLLGKIFKPVPMQVTAAGSSTSSAMISSINSTHAFDPFLLSQQDGLDSSNSAEEVMKELKAKEMYLRARLSEVKRQEDNMMRIRQEKSVFKETHQQRRVQGQSGTASPKQLSDDAFLSIGSNHFSFREQQENTSKVSIEPIKTQRATFGTVTRQDESYPRRQSYNMSKKHADLLLDLLADD